MSLSATLKPVTRGFQLRLTPLRDTVAIGILDVENLLDMVNDPVRVEQDAARDRKAGHSQDEYSRLREMVQRLVGAASSSKAKNVGSYADYLAAGLLGHLGDAWSAPPVTLWSPRPLVIDPETGEAFFPIRDGLIAIDGETQITALHRIKKNPGAFHLDSDFDFGSVLIAFEVYHGISAVSARQIFHDRNNKGAPVDKSLAMSMDMRDFGTTVTQQLIDSTTVTIDGEEVSLARLVLAGKRQVGPTAKEWFTLQGLRTLVVTTMLGRSGIQAASADVDIKDIEGDPAPEQSAVMREIVEILSKFLRDNADLFNGKTAITAPAVLAALGALLHRETSWTKDPMTQGETVEDLLADVRWQREASYWSGVAAKPNVRGGLNWGGGARDSGHKVYEALSKPTSEVGRQVRGLPYQAATTV